MGSRQWISGLTVAALCISWCSYGFSEDMKRGDRYMDGYMDGERLRYHGFAYFDDVLEHKEELRALRAYSNWVMPWAAEHCLRGRYPVSLLGEVEHRDQIIRDFLAKEGERIAFLDSLGYTIMWNLPLYELMREGRFEEYKTQLRVIKQYLPEMALVDYVYVFDEPDLHGLPSTGDLEFYIDELKAVFPGVKTTICYAIVQPKFLRVVPPKNLDLLSVDPYMDGEENTATDFKKIYRQRFALALSWVHQWEKPWFLAADCLYRSSEGGKRLPSPGASLWYYQIALTQPKCIGIAWCYYGRKRIESEDLDGLVPGQHPEIEKVHQEIGAAILGEAAPLGLPGEIGPPPPELR